MQKPGLNVVESADPGEWMVLVDFFFQLVRGDTRVDLSRLQ